MVSFVYKICPAPLWREAERAAVFSGSDVDRRDGFIHFSTAGKSSKPPKSILPVNTISFW